MRSGATLTNWRFVCNAYAATEAGRAFVAIGNETATADRLPSIAVDFESSAAFSRPVRFAFDDCMVNAAERFELYKRLSVITIV